MSQIPFKKALKCLNFPLQNSSDSFTKQSLKTGILHRFGFCQYKNYCQTSHTLGKIKEFYNSRTGLRLRYLNTEPEARFILTSNKTIWNTRKFHEYTKNKMKNKQEVE
jgi:hypothetical protein